MNSAKVKVDQVKAIDSEILVTACENRHTQLHKLNDHYKMGVEVKFLSSIVFLIPPNHNLTASVKSQPAEGPGGFDHIFRFLLDILFYIVGLIIDSIK